jgi:hypothetical protein
VEFEPWSLLAKRTLRLVASRRQISTVYYLQKIA